MKKVLSPVLQVLGIGWFLLITIKYFQYHPEYFGNAKLQSAFALSGKIIPFLIMLGVFYIIWVLYQATFKEKEKIILPNLTPLKVLGFFLGFVLFFADYWFLVNQFGKEVSFIHAQISLISKLALVVLVLLSLTLLAFASGKKILTLMKIKVETILGDSLLAIALGLGVIMLGVFVLGYIGFLNPIYIGALFLVLLVLTYKEVILFLKRFCLQKFEFEARFFSFEILFLFVLVFVLTLNVIDLIRPMPIGWDDMGVYLNYPKQMAGIEALLSGTTNNYFLLATLPFVFIKNQYLAAMSGMFVSFWGGVLMLFALAALATRFFKKEYALMLATLMYVIPMTMHQSYADMKTDMMLFFFMIMSIFVVYEWFTKTTKNNKWLILAGVLAGIAFGIKPTAILLIFAIIIGIFYTYWSWQGALGVFLLEWIILRFSGSLRLLNGVDHQLVLGGEIVLGLMAMCCFIFAIRKNKQTQKLLMSLVVFIFALGVAFMPWLSKNMDETGYNLQIGALLNGKDIARPVMDLKSVDVDKSTCEHTAHTEELERYLGYDEGVGRYLTLPWKITMNTTVHGFYLDLSFLFLSFLPMGLILLWLRRKDLEETEYKKWKLLVLMGVAVWSMWMLVGSGVIWYGIFGFIFILLITAYFFYENETLSFKITAGTMVVISLITVVALRGTKFANHATIKYAYGIADGAEVVELIVPDYAKITCIVTGGKWRDETKFCQPFQQEKSTIYRVGTFIAYFIPDNNRRLFNDAQLDMFKCIDDSTGNDDLETMRKLLKLGYKYFIFDLNTATIEKDPNGSLHKKANRFVEWVNNLSQKEKMYVHVYNPGKGIAFMEITDEQKIKVDDQ